MDVTVRPWDPATIAVSEQANMLVQKAINNIRALKLQRHHRDEGPKPRQLSEANAEKERATVGALLLDVLAHRISLDPNPLMIRLDNNWLTQAGPPARNRTVGDRLQQLDELGWLNVRYNQRVNGRFITLLEAGPKLIETSEAMKVRLDDVAITCRPDVLELRGKKTSKHRPRKSLKLPNDDKVEALQSEMQALNEWLSRANLGSRDIENRKIDTRRRHLSRVFLDGTLCHGGRTSGTAFWLTLPKTNRRSCLLIDEEPIAEVDIVAAVPSIAYAEQGQMPVGDPYDLHEYPDVERDLVKIVMMQLLWRSYSSRFRLPGDVRQSVDSQIRAADLVEAIKARNWPIRTLLGASKPAGPRLQRIESDIIVSSALRSHEAGISALPLHDALLVPASKAAASKEILEQTFKARLGQTPDISVEFH